MTVSNFKNYFLVGYCWYGKMLWIFVYFCILILYPAILLSSFINTNYLLFLGKYFISFTNNDGFYLCIYNPYASDLFNFLSLSL